MIFIKNTNKNKQKKALVLCYESETTIAFQDAKNKWNRMDHQGIEPERLLINTLYKVKISGDFPRV